MATAITEEFNDRLGRFLNYVPYDVSDSEVLGKLQHIDIGRFWSPQSTSPLEALDEFEMRELNGSRSLGQKLIQKML